MWFGAWLSRWQQRADAAAAGHEKRLAQMQQLVVDQDVAARWLSEPDDVQDGQPAQGPVHPVGEGQLADGRVAHVLVLEVLGVPLAKAPRVGRGGVQDVLHGVFDILGQGVEDLRGRRGEADRVRLSGHRRLPRSSAMSVNSLSS